MEGRQGKKNSLWSGQLPRHLQLAGLHRHPFRGNFPQDLEDATVDSPRERFAGTAERGGGSIERSGRRVWRGVGAADGMGWDGMGQVPGSSSGGGLCSKGGQGLGEPGSSSGSSRSRRVRDPGRQTQLRSTALLGLQHGAGAALGWPRSASRRDLLCLPLVIFSQYVLFVQFFRVYLSTLCAHPTVARCAPHYHVYSYPDYR